MSGLIQVRMRDNCLKGRVLMAGHLQRRVAKGLMAGLPETINSPMQRNVYNQDHQEVLAIAGHLQHKAPDGLIQVRMHDNCLKGQVLMAGHPEHRVQDGPIIGLPVVATDLIQARMSSGLLEGLQAVLIFSGRSGSSSRSSGAPRSSSSNHSSRGRR